MPVSIIFFLQPSRELLLTPYNIEFYATFLKPDADVKGRIIHFGPGVANERLLTVPIGEIDPHATIVVTVGLEKSRFNTASVDCDPGIGISDGTSENQFWIVDVNNYPSLSPCYPTSGTQDHAKVAAGTPVSGTFKLTFSPFNKLGICETAQEGGYINTGTFNAQMDVFKPLFLTVRRDHASEQYYFHYFKVEIYQNLID